MRRSPSTTAVLAAVAALSLTAAGCGHDMKDDKQDAMAGMDHSTMDHGSMTSTNGQKMAMNEVSSKSVDGVKLTVMTGEPETFYVADGNTRREHAPAPGDNAHLMVALSDDESGIRLSDAAVTARVTGPDGKAAFDGPLYPMIGRAAGVHYGENISFGKAGDYKIAIVAGPPRIGRHSEVKDAWTKTIRVTEPLRWDGKQAMAAE